MLKTISLKNVEYSVGERHILSGVSFKCTENERICIFGENGAGKSTMLKILCGIIEADDGVVEKQGHVRFQYVPQEFDRANHGLSIEEYIKKNAGEALFKKVFSMGMQLGFDLEKNKAQTCGGLSGGQQKILALSVAFALQPDFMLLDEPENHLDIVSRKELMGIMDDFRGGIIFISHDRLIIDVVATKIGELASGKLMISEGNYDDYVEMKMERIGGLQRQYDAETKRIKQLESSISILRQKAFRGKEVSAYRKALEELDRMKKEHKDSDRPSDEKTKIKIAQTNSKLHNGKLLCRIKDAAYKYEGGKANIFNGASLEIRSGEKIVLLGRNGGGKSTFLKCLMQNLPLTEGEVVWSDDISRAYFDQHAEFDQELRPVQIVMEKLNCFEEEAQAALGAMKFDVARMKSQVKNLSGGEKMRLRFALAFGLKPDFIILDEPTNHIDEVTWEILLEACKAYKGSILLVTHDYEFIQDLEPSAYWVIHNQEIRVRYKDLDTLLDELRG